MINVPCCVDIDREKNTVVIEIPFGENMILGFIYNLDRNNIENSNILYDKIIQTRKDYSLVKELIIPKINRKKKANYGKKFTNELEQIHLGEIIYGNLYNIDIVTDIELELTIDKEVSKNKYEIISNIDEIKINHKCYFYIKNNNINRILLTGLIDY